MIIFKTLQYKNFLGAGNSPITIQLNRSKTTLIIGSNGSGKSSGILDGITFALFNKPFRDIKREQLINTINLKQCFVEITFSIGTKEYIVRRGIKPDVFEILCDGVLIKRIASAREYQAMLEDQILHMNYKTFVQVVLLSVANFKPFMQLEAKERRDVIEDILDIKIFSAMNSILKDKASTLKQLVTAIDGNIDVQKQKLEIQKKYVETLCTDMQEKEKSLLKEISDANENILAFDEKIEYHERNVASLQDTINDEPAITGKKAKLSPITRPLHAKLATLKETLAFYSDTDICPTCTQSIGDDIKQAQLDHNTAKISEVTIAIDQLQAQLDNITAREREIYAVKENINRENREIQALNNQIIAEQNYIRKINNELASIGKNTGNIEQEQQKVKELAEGALNLVRQKSELSESKQFNDIAATLLKDSGIKTKIIEQYLPVINKLINKYLASMDTWISFHLDAEFNETIKSRYRDTFSYASFSEGEKQRIDLAILFTWRTIAKMKNSVSCNLLVFDEILDKALDTQGTEFVVQLLDTLGESSNVFVISHKVTELQDKFRSIIKFEKVNNFSQIVV